MELVPLKFDSCKRNQMYFSAKNKNGPSRPNLPAGPDNPEKIPLDASLPLAAVATRFALLAADLPSAPRLSHSSTPLSWRCQGSLRGPASPAVCQFSVRYEPPESSFTVGCVAGVGRSKNSGAITASAKSCDIAPIWSP